MPRITLVPQNTCVEAPAGTPLQDLLFPHGVEFPCGGRGTCRNCRVRVLAGDLPAHADDRRVFTAAELADGWRLGCRGTLRGDLTLQLAQWTAAILADDTRVQVEPRDGLGVAIDLGSTTLVAQLVDRADGRVLGVKTALNPQAQHGGDLMSRIDFARAGGALRLRDLVRGRLGELVGELAPLAEGRPIARIAVVGNTVMHHLFGGIDIAPLAARPFEPVDDGLKRFTAAELGWTAGGGAEVLFLPCLGGFVGSDILAGIVATRLHESDRPLVLVDLGTNGEIVVGDRRGMLCASTAAGPAFEGACISCGMRAMTGAISGVTQDGEGLKLSVLGGGAARGVCGSGLVDAVAVGLNSGRIAANGRITTPDKRLPLTADVALVQKDVRELQLAKGAIAAGIDLLLRRQGRTLADVHRVYLAGAFGNYISRTSAHRLGLIPFAPEMVVPAGNTALLGARLALNRDDLGYADLRSQVQHVALKEDPLFEEAYVAHMAYPVV